MKIIKYLAAIMAVVMIAGQAWAQKLDPMQVIWSAGKTNIPINEAKNGVDLESVPTPLYNDVRSGAAQGGELGLHCIFQASELRRNFPDGIEYVVKWYYYMSTRKMLMSTQLYKVDYTDSDSQGMVTLTTNPKLKFRPGWWEVVVLNRDNGDSLRYAGNSSYQIYIK